MGRIISYRDLEVWQESKKLAVKTYKFTNYLPSEERFSLCDQMRRAAVSVPSNIAEGQQRPSTKEFLHFLYISKGSISELITQLEITNELYPEFNKLIDPLLDEYIIVSKKITNLIKSLKNKLNSSILKKTTR